MIFRKPAFVTLTGLDRTEHVEDLVRLSVEFSGRLECGVLVSREQGGTDRFPEASVIDELRRHGLRLSAHLCGSLAEQVFKGEGISFDLAGFSRVQINLLGRHAASLETERAIEFGHRHGIRVILQCGGNYPTERRCDWLLDSSYGQGRRLASVPAMTETSAFCGISGGLASGNVRDILHASAASTGDRPYWIDTESALVEAGHFSPDACATFLDTVFS